MSRQSFLALAPKSKWLQLPHAVLSNCLQFVGSRDICQVDCVCREWQLNASTSDFLWKLICDREWRIQPYPNKKMMEFLEVDGPSTHWKKRFQRRKELSDKWISGELKRTEHKGVLLATVTACTLSRSCLGHSILWAGCTGGQIYAVHTGEKGYIEHRLLDMTLFSYCISAIATTLTASIVCAGNGQGDLRVWYRSATNEFNSPFELIPNEEAQGRYVSRLSISGNHLFVAYTGYGIRSSHPQRPEFCIFDLHSRQCTRINMDDRVSNGFAIADIDWCHFRV